MAEKKLGQYGKEIVEKNILLENPDIPIEHKVVVAKEMPKMVDIIFNNYRDTGVAISFHYASATHPLGRYTLVPGQKYTLPQEIVDHLHGDIPYDLKACHEPIHGIRRDLEGINQSYIKDYKQLFQCKIVRT
jgi:hypothetical protein